MKKRNRLLFIREDKLTEMLRTQYADGYSQGMIDAILDQTPSFEAENEEIGKRGIFSDGEREYVYRGNVR